jgi:hypothetical protein
MQILLLPPSLGTDQSSAGLEWRRNSDVKLPMNARMLCTKAMMLAVATATATLMVGGCDRPGANQPAPVGMRSNSARVANLAEKSVD